MAAHQTPPSLGFSRQEHWSGLPFPSPMHESEKWKWSRPVVSNSSRSHGLQPIRLLHPWDFPGKSTGVGCHRLLRKIRVSSIKKISGRHDFVDICTRSSGKHWSGGMRAVKERKLGWLTRGFHVRKNVMQRQDVCRSIPSNIRRMFQSCWADKR